MTLPSIHSVQEQTQSAAASSTVPAAEIDGKSSSPGPAVNAGKKSLLDRLEIIESNLRLNSGRSSSVKERIELCESELMGDSCDETLLERVAEMEAHLGL